MTDDYAIDNGEEDFCPNSDDNKHRPNWNTVSTESDGGTWYIDVRCKECGRSGCVGTEDQLIDQICW